MKEVRGMGEKGRRRDLIEEILDRLGVREVPFFRTPDYMYNPSYWLGAMVTAAFLYTVITGLLLLVNYIPADAYGSTHDIINSVPYGAVLLFSHLYGSYAMIVLAYVHMFRNYYKGAYKSPRELQWVTGVILLALTLGASFFGYSLVGDVLGVNAAYIGETLLVGTGFPGAQTLASWLFGPGATAAASSNPLIRSLLFDRLLGWHIILVALIGVVFAVHFLLSERYGMTPSLRERPRVPAYYTKEEWSKFNPWWPRNFVYMLSIVLLTWGLILLIPDLLAHVNGLPIVINPQPAPQYGTSQALSTSPYPPWFFLFLYKLVDLLLPNGQAMPPSMVVSLLIVGLLILMFMPFYENSNTLYLRERKFWTWIMSTTAVSIVILSVWGYEEPGVPAPLQQQILYLGVPALVVGALILILSGEKVQEDLSKVLGELKSLGKLNAGPHGVLLLTVSVLALAGTFGNALTFPSAFTLSSLVPLGLFTGLLASRFVSPRGEGVRSSQMGPAKRAAFYALIALLVISIGLCYLLWTLPSVGLDSTYAGAVLGAILMIWGEALQLYHYLVYVRP
jgi:quinol-cytochrome oxidoreductase complex cytochrome b subunit